MNALLLVGTASFAGKSLIATALCRILHRRGYRVIPFKGEETSAIAYTTSEGIPIGYFQAIQAWAAEVEPGPDLNPVFLRKGQGSAIEQIYINGHAWPTDKLRPDHYTQKAQAAIRQSVDHLQEQCDILLCDGHGNPTDLCHPVTNFSNMPLAKYLQAPAILVIDADRGGWLAHTVGTLALMEPEDRDRVRGLIINKVRGGRGAIQASIDWLEQRTGVPVLGTIPWMPHMFPSPDSIDLFARRRRRSDLETSVALIRLPHLANYSDLDPLVAEPTVDVRYVDLDQELGYPDAAVIPHSRDPISDLQDLFSSGMADTLQQYADAGGTVVGLGNGMQLLGQQVANPDHLGLEIGTLPGLDLLPIAATITQRVVEQHRSVTSNYPQVGLPIIGHEIRQGYTQLLNTEETNFLFDDPKLGVVAPHHSVWGTYLHTIFDSGPWRRSWLNGLRHRRGLPSLATGIPDYQEHREILLDALADEVSTDFNLDTLLSVIKHPL
jgi:adenosylcobyric acid synthase